MKIKLNENFKCLSQNYLFSEISRRVEEVKNNMLFESDSNSNQKRIISLGIGDVTLPIAPSVAKEMSRAALELSTAEGFYGYGDTQGSVLLRDAICRKYEGRGVKLCSDEIFINDGAKSDLGNLNDILGDNPALIIAPTYPVYLDASIISGRKVQFLVANKENDFVPTPEQLDLSPFVIYLCSPNNPTGAVFDKQSLQKWVDFAAKSGSLIVFDAAYESFITSDELPHSIFEIKGAKECAIEVCSLSKMAGFTGVRCGWTAIAQENPLLALWKRRQNAKFNGASYIAQRGALAVLSPQGTAECSKSIAYYMENARIIADFLTQKDIYFTGGKHAPYLWVKCPQGESSWQFFDCLLAKAHVVCTPGAGFGSVGEGFVRLSAFAPQNDILEALQRINKIW